MKDARIMWFLLSSVVLVASVVMLLPLMLLSSGKIIDSEEEKAVDEDVMGAKVVVGKWENVVELSELEFVLLVLLLLLFLGQSVQWQIVT